MTAKSPSELTAQTLIKRVMSGTSDKEHLTAFANLPITELHHNSFNYHDIIVKWNELQKNPPKVRYMTFAVSKNLGVIKKKIAEYYADSKWAYIIHDKDTSAEHKHLHCVLIFENPRSLKSIANDLNLPLPMVQKVWSKKGILDYLTHENSPDKYHYSLSDVIANFDVIEEKEKSDKSGKTDLVGFWDMYKKMRSGYITKDDFIKFINTDFTTLY